MQDRYNCVSRKETSDSYVFNQSFGFVLVVAFTALTISYGIEVLQKIQPCRICHVQRLCYFLLGMLSIFGIFLESKKAIRISIILASLGSISLACYHIGVQHDLLTDFCSITAPTDINDFKKMLQEKRSTCSQIHKVLGVPFSVWNLLISLSITKIITRSFPLKRDHLLTTR